MTEWSLTVPTEGSIELPPDPRAMDAIGRNHSLPTALADLVDNSIDAGATRVLVRIVKVGERLTSLYVVDNGNGMSPDAIDAAMTVGGRREYGDGDLGHFGLGLKAASFSQARKLTVMSRAAGHEAVGRRWRLAADGGRDFACDVVPRQFAESELDRDWDVELDGSGTVIRWDDVVAFPATDDPRRIDEFIDHMITNACQHIGMVFHRFLEQDRLSVDFDVHEVDTGFVGPPIPVTPLNPFGYARSGRPDFPQTLTAEDGDLKLTFRCHLWPGQSGNPSFQLTGNPVSHQGLYFYRRDRLLQAGGWEGVHAPNPKLRLARVEVDVDNDIIGLFRMNPEKSRVNVGPEFARLAASARSADGLSLDKYFDLAEAVYTESRKRSTKRTPMVYPGAGLPPRVRDTIKREIPEKSGEEPIDIRWDTFTDDLLFHVDRDRRTLWLNKRYRRMLLGGKHGGLNDLPLLKSLLYLLVSNVFEGSHLGPKDKDNIALWQTILTAAARAERQ
ncbi:histidine kinase/DNA gyrase B/HSP90-like ATPase [Saccharothrix texasensis]|uniref:Histidine kinase/DNA gyrase B/HSP90-like ATPase n=1 Tax=Saccharothrix texasensis TaxID=103734 RepID=A0A3N1HEW0_9PSEU|nr:histidine kinase/DNA gyrase B/HSP90-like ATPase [Saccharothrix texasensis]